MHPSSSAIQRVAAAALVLAPFALATISVTFPVGSSSCAGGQRCGPIKWQIDDSVSPPGADFGPTSVGIYTGSVNEQTLFLDIGTVADPVDTLELPALNIPADTGPNGDFYFVRYQSLSATDPATGYPLQAFSAKFSLTGMTGELSAAAMAQINGTPASSTRAAATTGRNSRTSSTATSQSSSSTSSGASGIGAAGARVTGGSKNSTSSSSSSDKDGGAGSSINNQGMTVSLVAFMGAAAYLAL